ncbi:uncharacterized protein LOC144434616 [Glandiceps talaboti]
MHRSIVKKVEEIQNAVNVAGKKRFACLLCPKAKFKPNYIDKAKRHYKTHKKSGVKVSHGYVVLVCHLDCREYTRDDHGHYHCPECKRTLARKEGFENHWEKKCKDQFMQPRTDGQHREVDNSINHAHAGAKRKGANCISPQPRTKLRKLVDQNTQGNVSGSNDLALQPVQPVPKRQSASPDNPSMFTAIQESYKSVFVNDDQKEHFRGAEGVIGLTEKGNPITHPSDDLMAHFEDAQKNCIIQSRNDLRGGLLHEDLLGNNICNPYKEATLEAKPNLQESLAFSVNLLSQQQSEYIKHKPEHPWMPKSTEPIQNQNPTLPKLPFHSGYFPEYEEVSVQDSGILEDPFIPPELLQRFEVDHVGLDPYDGMDEPSHFLNSNYDT